MRAGCVLTPLAVVLAACTSTPADPISMIPPNVQATVVAEEKLREAREQANAGDPAARSTSVQDILARARAEGAAPAQGGDGAQAPAPAGAPATGGAPAAPAPAGAAAPTAGKPARTAPAPREFEIVFEGTTDQPPERELVAFQKAWKAAKVSDKTQVMITAGPGGGGSAFDQALLANRRLRTVRSLLPATVNARQHYDPEFVPDTVRIVVGAMD